MQIGARIEQNQLGRCAYCNTRLGADRVEIRLSSRSVWERTAAEVCPRCAGREKWLAIFVWVLVVAVVGAVAYMMFSNP
jgi:hypothetical protein